MILLLLSLACSDPPPPSAPAVQPEPAVEPAAADQDTGTRQASTNRDPVITSISVTPARPTAHDDVVVEVTAVDPDGGHPRLDYTWTINGQEIFGLHSPELSHDRFSKGDELRLVVEASDGEVEVEGSTRVIVVANTPPEILNKPGSLRKVEGFKVQAEDLDDDPLSFRLEGEPEGMSIDARTGVLHYTGSEEAEGGAYQVTIYAEDDDGGSARWQFGITVQAGSPGKKGQAAEEEEPPTRRRRSSRDEEPKEDEEEEDVWEDEDEE